MMQDNLEDKANFKDVQNLIDHLRNMNKVLYSEIIDAAIVKLLDMDDTIHGLREGRYPL